MKRTLTIIEGPSQGKVVPLASALMIIGRSKTADVQLDDPLVSRCHLEIRIEADQVFIEDKSSHGSLLNGKKLAGVVSLNADDVITVGHSKLRYNEQADEPAPVHATAGGVAEQEGEGGETKFASDSALAGQLDDDEQEEKPDATRAVVEDGTRMLDASELPNWKAPTKEQAPAAKKSLWISIAGIVVVLAALGVWWWQHGNDATASAELDRYSDSEYVFTLNYPVNWGPQNDCTGALRCWGVGSEGGKTWTRVAVYADRHPLNALTGLSEGFSAYRKVLKERYKGFDLLGKKKVVNNEVTAIFFSFSATGIKGKGIFLFNNEARVAVECFSALPAYAQQEKVFTTVWQSFRLQEGYSQQFIEFPQPDAGMQQLALGSPAELARQFAEACDRGAALVANKDVKLDNLYQAVQEYRRACQLALAPPERLAKYNTAAEGLRKATLLYSQAIERQMFEINRALRERDRDTAYWEAHKIMQMVPDKTDPVYQKAFAMTKKLRPPE